jgi:ATP-binding cassette subfamily F protein uup
MKNPNFLILDEPTNDLDVITLNILEDWLLEFPGCTIIVSHDRYLLDKLCDHLFIFEGNGHIKDFNGRYMDYRATKMEEEREQRRQEKPLEQKPNQPASRTESGLTNKEKNEMKKLEREIGDLEERKAKLHDKFSQAGLSVADIDQFSKELKQVEEALEEKEMRWLELAER